MKYINAVKVLPDCLIQELQEYVQGDYLYIPIKKENQREWGTLSGSKFATLGRNKEIIEKYQNGIPVNDLAETYFLSTHAIRKILYQK